MVRYTTPVLPLIVAADLTGCEVYASLQQTVNGVKKEITKEISNFTVSEGKTTVNVTLTQQETAQFVVTKIRAAETDRVLVQVNWIDAGGNRNATEIKAINLGENLLDEVISYGG